MFGIQEFDAFLSKEDKSDTSHLLVTERMTDADIVTRNGFASMRPVVAQAFPKEGPKHIIYGDEQADLFLKDIYCAQEDWVVDTETGGHVHLHMHDVLMGLPRSQRRKIDVQGGGGLVLHFTPKGLEDSYILQKHGMVFIQPLYTKGFIVRGNVEFACVNEEGEPVMLSLQNFLLIKEQRLQQVAHSKLAQQPLKVLERNQQLGIAMAKQISSGLVNGVKQALGIAQDKGRTPPLPRKKPVAGKRR